MCIALSPLIRRVLLMLARFRVRLPTPPTLALLPIPIGCRHQPVWRDGADLAWAPDERWPASRPHPFLPPGRLPAAGRRPGR
jgi:hypothetical protein